jgi:hypothetical protein
VRKTEENKEENEASEREKQCIRLCARKKPLDREPRTA